MHKKLKIDQLRESMTNTFIVPLLCFGLILNDDIMAMLLYCYLIFLLETQLVYKIYSHRFSIDKVIWKSESACFRSVLQPWRVSDQAAVSQVETGRVAQLWPRQKTDVEPCSPDFNILLSNYIFYSFFLLDLLIHRSSRYASILVRWTSSFCLLTLVA